MLKERGLPGIYKDHEVLAAATRSAAKALGLELFASTPSPVLTTVKVPPQILDGKKIQKVMQEKHGVIVTGGQDELEGKIIRLSHFGYTDIFDITSGIAAFELALHELGYPVEFGKGVGAALKTFNDLS